MSMKHLYLIFSGSAFGAASMNKHISYITSKEILSYTDMYACLII